MSSFTRLEDGFSILKCGKSYHLNFYIQKNGETCSEYRSFESFKKAFEAYEQLRREYEQTK